MLRKVLIVGAILLALGIAAKKMRCDGYVRAIAHRIGESVKHQIPPQIELDRIREEIAQLDRDLENLYRPLAEHRYEVEFLRRQINNTRESLTAKKEQLETLVGDWSKNKSFVIHNTTYRGRHAQETLAHEFNSCKRLERTLETKTKVLAAKERQLASVKEQVEKLQAKKQEFELRLAELEANQEFLQLQATGSVPAIDQTRAAAIEEALQAMEREQEIQRIEIEMRNGQFSNSNDDRGPAVDVQEILNYLDNADRPTNVVGTGNK